MIRHFLNPPNWFTAASLVCGLYAIVLAGGMDGPPDLYRAGVMVLFAGVFDTIDGGVARLTGTGSDFGIQLDSLVDVVSFGVAPAILLYAGGLQALGWVGLAAAFWFAVCATFRLARFNTEADGTKTAWGKGLSVTMAGALVGSVAMAGSTWGPGWTSPALMLGLGLVLGLAMVSPVPYRGWKTLRLRPLDLMLVALMLGGMLVLGTTVDVSWAFVLGAAAYAASGPAEAAVRGRWRLEEGPSLAPRVPGAEER